MSVECRIHCTGSFDGIRKHSSPIRVFAAIGNADPGAPPHEREAPAAAMREAAPRRGPRRRRSRTSGTASTSRSAPSPPDPAANEILDESPGGCPQAIDVEKG